MCSTFKYENCMGRNFDYEVSYKEKIRIIDENTVDNKYKIIGMCTNLVPDYPLLYDGMNAYGLCVSALAFEGNAKYHKFQKGMNNVASYKMPLWILGSFKTVKELKKQLKVLNVTDEAYIQQFPVSDLHWFVCDKEDSIVIESTNNGVTIYEGAEVLTNNPPYSMQKKQCDCFNDSIGTFSPPKDKRNNTRGLETVGLHGDYTSQGRFAKLSWLKENISNGFDAVTQSLHLLGSVEQMHGITKVKDKYEYTIYSIVYDMENLDVYLKEYDCPVAFKYSL